MRVTQKAIYESTRFRLGKITTDLTEANLVVTTGKRINYLKDDPVGMSQVLSLKSNLSNLDQITRNTAMGRTWLNGGETALSSVSDMISKSKAVAVAMNNGTVDAAGRMAAAEEIRGYLMQIESIANTRVNDQYLFGGTKTDTIPFALDNQQNPTTATYSGNSTAFTVKTGKDTTVEVGHDGSTLFPNLFSSMIDLLNGLEANDVTRIGISIDNLGTNFDTINNAVAEIGSKVVRIDTKEKIIADLDLSYRENLAEVEEADIVEAISKLKATELAYQAALTSSSKLMNISLVDYM